ncbi:MAG: hypothetical protein QXF25_00205 [Candidatus Pacearchaeota archaeon]
MKRVIHVEDDFEFREIVRESLNKLVESGRLELIQVGDQKSFLDLNFEADLYIFDRHLPRVEGGRVEDSVWRTLVGVVYELYPNSKAILLSDNPPKDCDWRKHYRNIVEVMKKSDFNSKTFCSKIEDYLFGRGEIK